MFIGTGSVSHNDVLLMELQLLMELPLLPYLRYACIVVMKLRNSIMCCNELFSPSAYTTWSFSDKDRLP